MVIAAVGCGEDAANSPSPTTGSTGSMGGGGSTGGAGAAGGLAAVVGGGGMGGAGGSGGTPHYVFITSQMFAGNLSEAGAEAELGADAKCNAAAIAAGLPRTYHAFLSPGIYGEPPNTTIYSDIAPHERVRGDGPWVAVGTEEVVFGDRATLALNVANLEGKLRDENGNAPTPNGGSFVLYWSGSTGQGTAAVSCDRWRGTVVGQVGCVGGCEPWRWRSFSSDPTPCTEPQHLLCFGAPD